MGACARVRVLYCTQDISPMPGTTFWFPLFVVLAFSAAKDALEDYAHHCSDLEENSRCTEVRTGEQLVLH